MKKLTYSPDRIAALKYSGESNPLIAAFHAGAEYKRDQIYAILNQSEDNGELGDTLRDNLRKILANSTKIKLVDKTANS